MGYAAEYGYTNLFSGGPVTGKGTEDPPLPAR